jgi:hypothetical protein
MKSLRIICCSLLVVGGCGAPKGEPLLDLKLTPNAVSDGTVVQVSVIATAGDGTVGKGTVRITSAAGSLTAPVDLTLDSFGTARGPFTCDPTMESACARPVRVVAEWSTEGKVVIAEARLNSSSTGTGGGSGTGGGPGTGGGSGGGSGQPNDAGVIILTNQCSLQENPGAEGRCCYQPMASKAPTCGWSFVTPGSTFAIPFTLVDGGSPNTLAFVHYSVPARLSDTSECVPEFGLNVQPGGLTGTFSLSCYRFAVFPDLSWMLVTNNAAECGERVSTDVVGLNYLQADCRDMFSNNYAGSVRQMTGAVIVNSAGRWLQSDQAVYVIPMHR